MIPKSDIRQLLEKAKIDHKESIDKWTNEYEGTVLDYTGALTRTS